MSLKFSTMVCEKKNKITNSVDTVLTVSLGSQIWVKTTYIKIFGYLFTFFLILNVALLLKKNACDLIDYLYCKSMYSIRW